MLHIDVHEAYFHCGKALMRSRLWAAEKIERAVMPSIGEVKISLSVSNPEIHVAVDRKRAADLGVRMSTVGNTLRLAVAGDDEISNFREGAERYPVKLRVLENQRRDIDQEQGPGLGLDHAG